MLSSGFAAFHPTNHPPSHRIPVKERSPRRAGGFPENRSALQDVSGHPLLGFKRDIHQRLKVIETERGPVAPHPGLILEQARERRGEERTLLAGILPDRRLVN